MSLNLHLLRLFATVARHGGFSRAAQVLNISQPSISKSVRRARGRGGVARGARPRAGHTQEIGASTTIATYMLPGLLGAFARDHPAIELQLVSANTRAVADLMIGHEIEIALVEGPVEDRRLASEVWRTDPMVLIAAPDHHLAAAATIEVGRLAAEVLIVREPGSGSREIVAHALARHGVIPARTLEVGGTEAIKQTVAAGLGSPSSRPRR